MTGWKDGGVAVRWFIEEERSFAFEVFLVQKCCSDNGNQVDLVLQKLDVCIKCEFQGNAVMKRFVVIRLCAIDLDDWVVQGNIVNWNFESLFLYRRAALGDKSRLVRAYR